VIAAGFILLAIGASDLVRALVPARRRWIGFLAGAVVLLAVGALSAALPAVALALAVAAGWIWLSPLAAPARAGFWPIVVVGIVCAALVAALPARTDAGLIGGVWGFATPVGSLSFDHLVLLVGTVVFLLESANVVVRMALAQEDVQLARVAADSGSAGTDASAAAAETDASAAAAETDASAAAAETDASARPDAATTAATATDASTAHDPAAPSAASSVDPPMAAPLLVEPALKGGRLIGPLERLLVFALTLAAMYPLLAAILAAKGIVRFPEISRDSAAGNRAEYFLIGSLVSWVVALAAAFLVWWAFATP
jgi:hypothetical protein